jgi:hypothetical protein
MHSSRPWAPTLCPAAPRALTSTAGASHSTRYAAPTARCPANGRWPAAPPPPCSAHLRGEAMAPRAVARTAHLGCYFKWDVSGFGTSYGKCASWAPCGACRCMRENARASRRGGGGGCDKIRVLLFLELRIKNVEACVYPTRHSFGHHASALTLWYKMCFTPPRPSAQPQR